MINAKLETVTERPSYSPAFKKRRCLIPADAFYEWKKLNSKEKQPYANPMAEHETIAFGGLWERWKNPTIVEWVFTYSILTTKPNEQLKDIHHRMPVIIEPEHWDVWLDESNVTKEQLAYSLQHAAEGRLDIYPVSRIMLEPGNDAPECLVRLNENGGSIELSTD